MASPEAFSHQRLDEIQEVPVQAERGPIVEDENSISYLGVELEKGKIGSPMVPRRESYTDYISDEFALKLQQKIAICLKSGEPLLIEGGTSIGKTTTIRKMAAELGWEVHYINLTGATDVEDLMGRYIPNVERVRLDDPEYKFADGKITAGLRPEEGKKKIILLDELNAAPPNILIRLHEVLDALERGGEVVLSEDASEAVPVSREQTKVVALMNPPGKGYFGREPLDPAQLRRWVYQKEATTLPTSTFEHSTAALFGLEKEQAELPPETYLSSPHEALTSEQLAEIPGISEILVQYREFHQAAQKMLKNRSLAQDQPQPFYYDDRMEPRRVRDFVQRFFTGDITDTFQKALSYYYGGKLESEDDRIKLAELISQVHYTAPVESRRRELGAATREAPQTQEVVEGEATPPERTPRTLSEEVVSLMDVERIMGAENIFGREQLRAAGFGELSAADVPPVPFTRSELERAKELNQLLVLRIDSLEPGKLLTAQKVKEMFQEKLEREGKGKLFYDQDWYVGERCFTTESPRRGWALIDPELIPDSTSKNYLEQTDTIALRLETEVFKDMEIPEEYSEAISEFVTMRRDIEGIMSSDWQRASQLLADLKLTRLTRPSMVEQLYDTALVYASTGRRLHEGDYSWTKSRASSGGLVDVGLFDSAGAEVGRPMPSDSRDSLGVSLSRSR